MALNRFQKKRIFLLRMAYWHRGTEWLWKIEYCGSVKVVHGGKILQKYERFRYGRCYILGTSNKPSKNISEVSLS